MSKNDSTSPATRLLTVKETSKRLSCSVALVYALCEKGRLAHVRLGLGRGTIRVSQSNLDAFIASCTIDVGGLGKPPASGRGFQQLNQEKLLKAWTKKSG